MLSYLFPVYFSACTLSSYRWSKMVGNGACFRDTFIALFSGLFINNVLPARIGEIARGYVLSKRTGLSFTYSVTTVFVDRFFDLIGLLIITFITLFFLPEAYPAQEVKWAIYHAPRSSHVLYRPYCYPEQKKSR